MRPSDRSLYAAIILFLTIMTLPAAALGAELRIIPAASDVKIGDAVTVSLKLDTVDDLSGFQLKTAFNPVTLEVTAMTINTGFDRQLKNSFDNTTGQLSLAGVSLTSPPINGADISLATIVFKAKGNGTANIVPAGAILGSSAGEEIPVAVFSATVSVTGDNIVPTVTGFTIPANATDLTVAILTFTASDNTAVTGYLITESTTAPAASDSGWSSSVPASYTFATGGAKTLYAWAKDAAGNVSAGLSATTTITLVDLVKPVIVLSTLADGAKTNLSPLNISGTVTDNVAVTTFTINGTAVTPGQGGAFSHAVPLAAGANTITAIASDDGGNSATVTLTVYYENVAPVISITSPATDNSFTNKAALTISGTVNETAVVAVSFNGTDLTTVTRTGNNFTADVTLVSGQNTINYNATDEYGNLAQSLKRTITYDAQPPAVAITSPGLDIVTNSSSYLVKGDVTDNLANVTVAMTFDGQIYNPAVVNGKFEQQVSFTADKTYQISVVATDGAGNSSPAVLRNIIYDSKLPAFAITTAKFITAAADFTLSGIKEIGATVTATCATATGVTVSEPDPASWRVELTGIAAGANQVLLTATSTANNKTDLSATVIRDNTAPAVDSFTLPNLYNSLNVPVSALTASDANGIAAYIVTESATPPAADAGGWGATAPAGYTFPTEGFKTVYAWAMDNAGNISAFKSATTTIDTTSPAVSIVTKPAAVVKVTGATVTFSSTDPAATFECKLDTAAFAACTSPKTYSQLAEGAHNFTVRAKDLAGNISTNSSASWTVDTTRPLLTVSTLSNGAATNHTPLNITGTVTDTSGIASLTVNGAAATVAAGGSYSYALPLTTEGDVAISIIATDNAGNTVTNSRTIRYDITLPALTVTAPADNSQTKDAVLTVTGTISENGTVEINNTTSSTSQPATVSGTSFSGTVPLSSGTNTIEVTVTDQAGNRSTSVKRTILYDPNSPALAITEPAHDIQLHNPAVTIKGTVSDETSTSVKLTFTGTDYPQTVTAGQFQQNITIPAEGSYPVTVTATDAVGNPPTTVTRNIIYTPYPGDTNGDGNTTKLIEVLKAFQYVYGQKALTPTEKLRLDVAPLGTDGKPAPNGVIDIHDVILLLRRIVGLVNW